MRTIVGIVILVIGGSLAVGLFIVMVNGSRANADRARCADNLPRINQQYLQDESAEGQSVSRRDGRSGQVAARAAVELGRAGTRPPRSSRGQPYDRSGRALGRG